MNSYTGEISELFNGFAQKNICFVSLRVNNLVADSLSEFPRNNINDGNDDSIASSATSSTERPSVAAAG